ncbi:hypothetical protein DD238_007320 [Peronospora effusa]|uniref:Uncharacterized protein n=1 Tax=Peronospora effusa TaxID=542832 RepID=A0A3M6VP26_9STRA|nr:hypothetical protein DD238_007320 [Peronospora effusa]
MSTSYLDIHLRLYIIHYGIQNVHFLAITVYERHTGEVIFSTACKALEAMLPQGISNVAKPGFIRFWCGAHQLDIVLQDVYLHFGDEKFMEN